MKITVDIPAVTGCSVDECTYNRNQQCHARAITVGDGVHPGCDTFFAAGSHAHDDSHTAGVGACKVSSCTHNDDYECAADQIEVGRRGSAVECLTFAAR